MAHEDERLLGRPVQLCHQPRVSPAGFRWDADVALATWLPCAKCSFIHVWDLRVESTFVVGRSPGMFYLTCPTLLILLLLPFSLWNA